MKFKKIVKVDVEVTTLRADMKVRYWEDGEVNGEQDSDECPQMPLRLGDYWVLDIDLETGKIKNWPEGTTASVHYKVCDAGTYSLLDAEGNSVISINEYVPAMLCPKDDGYGDYVIMDIDADGFIDGWKADLEYFYAYGPSVY